MTQRFVQDGPLIIGGGLAGLSAALEAGPRPTLVITPARLLEACSSAWAQGGMAAALLVWAPLTAVVTAGAALLLLVLFRPLYRPPA